MHYFIKTWKVFACCTKIHPLLSGNPDPSRSSGWRSLWPLWPTCRRQRWSPRVLQAFVALEAAQLRRFYHCCSCHFCCSQCKHSGEHPGPRTPCWHLHPYMGKQKAYRSRPHSRTQSAPFPPLGPEPCTPCAISSKYGEYSPVALKCIRFHLGIPILTNTPSRNSALLVSKWGEPVFISGRYLIISARSSKRSFKNFSFLKN